MLILLLLSIDHARFRNTIEPFFFVSELNSKLVQFWIFHGSYTTQTNRDTIIQCIVYFLWWSRNTNTFTQITDFVCWFWWYLCRVITISSFTITANMEWMPYKLSAVNFAYVPFTWTTLLLLCSCCSCCWWYFLLAFFIFTIMHKDLITESHEMIASRYFHIHTRCHKTVTRSLD